MNELGHFVVRDQVADVSGMIFSSAYKKKKKEKASCELKMICDNGNSDDNDSDNNTGEDKDEENCFNILPRWFIS